MCLAGWFVLVKNWKPLRCPFLPGFSWDTLIKSLAQESASLTAPISESITVLGDTGLGLCPLLNLDTGMISSRTWGVRSLSCRCQGNQYGVGSTVVCGGWMGSELVGRVKIAFPGQSSTRNECGLLPAHEVLSPRRLPYATPSSLLFPCPGENQFNLSRPWGRQQASSLDSSPAQTPAVNSSQFYPHLLPVLRRPNFQISFSFRFD